MSDPEATQRSASSSLDGSSKTLLIESITRVQSDGQTESLGFRPGVNVIAGPPNTGKSKWLQFLDFALGDGGTAANAIGAELADEYAAVEAVLRVGSLTSSNTLDSAGETHVLERRWKEPGLAGKILVDGRKLNPDEFGEWLYDRLGIPILHFPSGNPYGPRSWPTLSWRMLLRQIYRQEHSWTEIADKQPEREQLAVLMQFLGMASALYSDEYGESVRLRKESIGLQAQRDALVRVLGRIASELGSFEEMNVAVTPTTVDQSRARLLAERAAVETQRDDVLRQLTTDSQSSDAPDGRAAQDLLDRLSAARLELQQLTEERAQAEVHARELRAYWTSIHAEHAKLNRARVAGRILAPLRVTDCPVCDRPIQVTAGSGRCYLCGRPDDSSLEIGEAASERIQFEIDQLANEDGELAEVVERADAERDKLRSAAGDASRRVMALEAQARPLRSAVAAIVPPQVMALEQRIGAVDERLRTLEGIGRLLGERDVISAEIDDLDHRARALDASADEKASHLSFSRAAGWLEDGLNTYLNMIKEGNPARWPEEPINVALSDKQLSMKVGTSKWDTILGGTFKCYFLNAYQYALMQLTGREGCHYPGLAIIDFPPAPLAEGDLQIKAEPFLLEPFTRLFDQMAPGQAQLIVAGPASLEVAGANKISLEEVYR